MPQYADYHEEVDYLDEVERIWGKRWGAQGIGRLREVAMSPPTEVESLPLYERIRLSSPTAARCPTSGRCGSSMR